MIENVPLPLNWPEETSSGAAQPARVESVRSVAFGSCPSCRSLKTGLIPLGAHLVWRAHNYTTYGGTVMPCPASGVPVCTAPSRGVGDVRCRCGS